MTPAQRDSLLSAASGIHTRRFFSICGQWDPRSQILWRPVGSAQSDFVVSAASGIWTKRFFTICGQRIRTVRFFIICGQWGPHEENLYYLRPVGSTQNNFCYLLSAASGIRAKGFFIYLRPVGSARRDFPISAASGVRAKRSFFVRGQWDPPRKETLYYLRPVGSAQNDFYYLRPAGSVQRDF